MEQLNLQPRHLIPYLGSKSRVSEILAGQRQPTVDQIRALNRHLGIPVESLIGETKHQAPSRASTASKAAIDKLRSLGVMKVRESIDAFLARAQKGTAALAMLRKSRTDRTNAKTDFGALEAWCAAVLLKAEQRTLPTSKRTKLDFAFARAIARLSVHTDGPARAADELMKAGVILVILDHLPGTYLDGAAICRGDGAPVIALTLRHDRLDNFWFTLLHELAHVIEHLGDGTAIIVDDLDVNSSGGIEAEADKFARDALIPPDVWTKYNDPDLTTDALLEMAVEAEVHPAIAAGRWRWEHRDYRRFSRLLGRGEVRNLVSTI
jgi:HTH-type transcriptional regulator/antitoxin HigA